MSVVKRVREVLGAEEAESQDVAGDEEDQSTSSDERATQLFQCDSCGTTYVSMEMDSCSQCQTPVETVPTEQDLGLL